MGEGYLPSIFWSLKKGIETFNFRSNESSRDVLGLLGRYDHPWGKKNKHASVIFLLEKNYKIPHFCRWELETSTVGFSNTLNLMALFSLRFYDF